MKLEKDNQRLHREVIDSINLLEDERKVFREQNKMIKEFSIHENTNSLKYNSHQK